MEIKVFGYEVRLEIVIACIIIGMVAGTLSAIGFLYANSVF